MSERPTWLVTGANGFLGANLGAFLDGRADAHRSRPSARRSPTRCSTATWRATWRTRSTSCAPSRTSARMSWCMPAAMASHEACEADPPARAAGQRVGVRGTRPRGRTAPGRVRADLDRRGLRRRSRPLHARRTSPARRPSTAGPSSRASSSPWPRRMRSSPARTSSAGAPPAAARSSSSSSTPLSNGEQVRGFTDFTTSSAYVQVLAEALWDLCALEATGLVHLTSPEALTKYEFGVAVAEEFGLDAGLITPTTSDCSPHARETSPSTWPRPSPWLGAALPSQREGIARAAADALTLRRSVAQASGN